MCNIPKRTQELANVMTAIRAVETVLKTCDLTLYQQLKLADSVHYLNGVYNDIKQNKKEW